MKTVPNKALLSFALVYASLFTGCVSDKLGAQLGATAIGGTLEAGLDPAFELAYASNAFRVAKHRWPKDYGELSSFLKQTDDRTYPSFQAVEYDRLQFTDMADGNLSIEADYSLNSTRQLNSSGRLSYTGNGKIEGMVVSPFDPHEMPTPR